ncbi:MAG: LamG-like jellyroll fold domain-containing protein, partial [Opitutus sp.]
MITPPSNGALSGFPSEAVVAAPGITYTPAANFFGTDSFTYEVRDGSATPAQATVTFTVLAINDAPVADAQALMTAEDTPLAVTLSGSDPENDALAFVVLTQPAHGTLNGTAPELTYTPAPNFFGSDSFTFKADDGAADSLAVAVMLTVTPVNDPPVAQAQAVEVTSGAAVTMAQVATDIDGDALTYTIVAPPAQGALTGAAPELTYTPAAGFTGTDSFAFKANDGAADSSSAMVTITVTPPPNQAPDITSAPVAGIELRADFGGSGLLRGTIRDFSKNHPNFEENLNQSSTFVVPGLVAPYIGEDRKPIPHNLGQTGSSTNTPENFNQWYRDVPGINFSRILELPVGETTPGSGIYAYRSDAFFPIDNEFYGSEGLTDGQTEHNFNFTCEFHTRFIYQPGQTITFGGDDAIWVFVDDRLVIDLGGVHVSVEATASLDGLGLIPGESYPMDFFHAEQHTGGSSFRLRTNLAFETAETYQYAVQATDADGDELTYSLTQAPAGMTIHPQTGILTWVVDRGAAGTHPVAVQVRDPDGLTDTQTYTLDVYVNAPPTITWSSRYLVDRISEPVPLAATVTDDGHPSGGSLAVEWSKLSGPGTVNFDSTAAASTQASFAEPGIYVVQLQAAEGSRITKSTVVVRIDSAGNVATGRQATSWWPGNDTPEDVIGGRHAEPLFGAGFAAGRVGSAFTFDGVNDIVRVRANPDLDVGVAPDGFSIGFWMYCEIDSPMAELLAWQTVTGQTGMSITMDNYLGSRRMWLNLRRPDGTNTSLGVEQMWPLNNWTHLVFAYDRATGVARIYRDGALKHEQFVGNLGLSTAADLWWGCLSGFNGNFFRGKLDEIMIHRRALTSAEVYAMFAAGAVGNLPPSGNQPPLVDAGPDLARRELALPIVLNGTVADDSLPANSSIGTQWSFVSGPAAPEFATPADAITSVTLPMAGTYVLKLSASDGEAISEDLVEIRTGQLTTRQPAGLVAWWTGNDTAQEAVGDLHGIWGNGPVYSAGAVSSAFTFDGNRRVSVPASPALDAGAWDGLSLEFWLRPTSATGNGTFLAWRNPSGSTGANVSLGYFFGWQLNIDLKDTTGVSHPVLPGYVISLDAWQHFVVSYDRGSGVARVYRNGAQVHEVVLGSFIPETRLPLHWGNVSDAGFRGSLDEISIYRRALPSGEANALFQAGAAGKEPAGPNLAPIVSAGPDQFMPGIAQVVALSGTADDDGLPDGNVLQSLWSRLSGPGNVIFGDSAAPATTATFDQPGIYVLQLEADDGLTRTTDTVEIRVGPFTATDAPSDLVAWWTGNQTTQDGAGMLHAEWVGSPAYTTGAVGAAFAFDGARFARVPASPVMNAATWSGLTLELWVRPSGMVQTSLGAPLVQWRNPNGQLGVSIEMTYRFGWNLSVNLTDTAGQAHSFAADGIALENVWQHLVITYDRASGRAVVFRNGQSLAESSVGSFTPQLTYDLLWANAGGSRFKGGLDEISVYRRALQAGEVSTLFSAGASGKITPDVNTAPQVAAGPDIIVPETGSPAALDGTVADDNEPFGPPVVTWSVADPVGSTAVQFADAGSAVTSATFDAPGMYLLKLTATDQLAQPVTDMALARVGLTGTFEPDAALAAWWPGNGDPHEVINGGHDAVLLYGTGYTSARVSQGFLFDGSNDRAQIAAHPDLDIGTSTAGLTIEFWARPSTLANGRALLSWGTATASGVEVFQNLNNGVTLELHLRDTAGGNHSMAAYPVFSANTWVHVAVTYDRATGLGRIYCNGILITENSLGVFTPRTNLPLTFGASLASGNYYAGVLDEISLYRRPLSVSEVHAIFQTGTTGKNPVDGNLPPVVSAGADITIADIGATAALDGSVSDDGRPAGASLVTTWSKVDGPGEVGFASPNAAATTATFGAAGTYLLRLQARDGFKQTSDLTLVRAGVTGLVNPDASLAAWWPGNGDPREVVRGTHPVELFNGTTYAAGRVSQAFFFDGVNDHGRIPAHADLDVGASPAGLTIEFWARPTTLANGRTLLGWGTATASGVELRQNLNGGVTLEAHLRDTAGGDHFMAAYPVFS